MIGSSKMSDKRYSEKSEGKVPRVPFSGPRLKLQLSEADMKGFKERGVVVRWFNDESGRIQQALGGGYNFVKPEHARSLGQGALHRESTDESKARVSVIVNRGDPAIRAYLMEIKKEFWEEDQAAKESVNQQVDDALAAGGAGGASIENQYGPGVTYSK
jgi:hypothetical protein